MMWRRAPRNPVEIQASKEFQELGVEYLPNAKRNGRRTYGMSSLWGMARYVEEVGTYGGCSDGLLCPLRR